MVAEYLRRSDLSQEDLRYHLEPGDAVLVKQRIPGKLQARAEGPYTFLRYLGQNNLGAEVMDPGGSTRTVAIANVRPYRGAHPANIPNRVWDLPPELQSEIMEMTDDGPSADVARATSAEISDGWTT
jgi:hypothetical protein